MRYVNYDTDDDGREYGQNMLYWGFTTSHGCQINPMFYVGAGMGWERQGTLIAWIAPVFVEGRADFQFGKFTPFCDLRAGVNFGDGIGAYLSPSVGYRFSLRGKLGLNVGAGLTLAGYKVEQYDIVATPDSFTMTYIGTSHPMRAYFSIRVGIDF